MLLSSVQSSIVEQQTCSNHLHLQGRDMGRVYICEKTGLKKGVWTSEEDSRLSDYVTRYGHSNWREVAKLAGLSRCGKSCRLRWMNYLRPNIKRGNYTREEEETIKRMHQQLGKRWSVIAASLPGRTDNEIKNYWHTRLKRRTTQQINSMDANSAPVKCKTPKAVHVAPLILESSGILPVQTLATSDGDDKSETSTVQDSYMSPSSTSTESAPVDETQFSNIAESREFASEAAMLDIDFWNELFSVPVSNMSDSSCSGNQVSNPESEISSGLTPYEFYGNFWTEPFLVEDGTAAALVDPTFLLSYYALEDDIYTYNGSR